MSRPIPSFPRYSDAEQEYGDFVEAYLEEHPGKNEQDAADDWYDRRDDYWERIADEQHCYSR